MTRKALTAITLAAGPLLWAGGASAAMIAAGSTLSLNGSDTFNATSITFTNPANIGAETGSFTVLANCTGCVTMTNVNTATPAGTLLYTATEAGPLTTTLTTTGGVPAFNFVPGTPLNNLTVTGTGTLTLTGFSPTPGNYTITTQGPTNVAVTFSVSATGTPTPEPASLAILGSALGGFGALGWWRRRRAV